MKFHHHARRGSRRSDSMAGPVDPDTFFSDVGHQKPDHHTRALCKQVHRTLSTVLGGECADPLLQDLLVLAVLPAPNAGHLLVIVSPQTVDASLADLLERLTAVTPLLRARIAQETTRKRTPELAFDVLGKGVISLEAPPSGSGTTDDLPSQEDRP